MQMKTMQDLTITGLTYVLDFEKQIGDAAPKMAKAATDAELKEMFEKTETKSDEYAKRVETVFEKFGQSSERNTNHLAKAMITEVEHMIDQTEPGPVRDAALITAVNQQQMYRVASYGSLRHYSELLGNQGAAQELAQALEDSKNGDEKFTAIAENRVNKQALSAA